jgi:hypothetical protein
VKKPWVVGGKTTKYFAISHVVGWILAKASNYLDCMVNE